MRLRQRTELKRVEIIYENLLIKETLFPKASETNHEIESWVESVMDNWRLLCGPTWDDNDLGEGGKEGVARSLLDVRIAYGVDITCTNNSAADPLSSGYENVPFNPDPTTSVHRSRIACRVRPGVQSIRLIRRYRHTRQGPD